jgi:dTDP-glucose 4,6-dehydratase
MKTVCVIGSNSFSGSDFIDHLLSRRDYRVIGVSRSSEKKPLFLPYLRNGNDARFSFIQCDLNKDMDTLKSVLTDTRPAYVVNFAAQSEVAPSWDAPEQWFQTNAIAVARLGKFLGGQNWLHRYVHISSPEVYGTCEGVIDETAPLNPSTPYAASKAAGDLMLFTLYRQYGFPLVMIRSTNVYGAHQQLFKIIPRTVIYLGIGKTIELHGGGRAVKSYIHIRDISRGELSAMEDGRPGEIYHLSPDNGVAVYDVVETICRKMGKDFEANTKIVTERPGQDRAYVIDSSKARDAFGWKPGITLDEGLNKVISWVQSNWEAVRHEPLAYVHKP